jgi:hypothetical protein
LKAKFETVHRNIASSADTIDAFNLGFDIGNLHRPTLPGRLVVDQPMKEVPSKRCAPTSFTVATKRITRVPAWWFRV